jgi:hypothetical protein
MLSINAIQRIYGGLPKGAKSPLTPKPVWVHYSAIKATAPLLAAMQERVIRWLFFCPDCPAVAQGGGF